MVSPRTIRTPPYGFPRTACHGRGSALPASAARARSLMSGVAAGEAGIVAVGSSEDGSGTWVSDDGFTWQRVEPDPLADGWVLDVVEDRGGFVAVGSIDLRPTIWTSADGSAWAPRPVTGVGDLALGFVKSATRFVGRPARNRLLGAGSRTRTIEQDRSGSRETMAQPGSRSLSFRSGDGCHRPHRPCFDVRGTRRGRHHVWSRCVSCAAIWISVDEGITWEEVPNVQNRFGDDGAQSARAYDITILADRVVVVGALGGEAMAWVGEWTN